MRCSIARIIVMLAFAGGCAPTRSVAPTSQECPNGVFETNLATLTRLSAEHPNPAIPRDQTSNLREPIEISRIRTGAISFFAGAFINDGLITWYAFDVERHLFIAVLGTAGKQLTHVPQTTKLGANQFLRYTDAAGYKRAEFVTLVDADPVDVREFSCLANRLLAAPSTSEVQPMMTDTLSRGLRLWSDGKTIDPGRGTAKWTLQERLEGLIADPLRTPIMRAFGQPPSPGDVAVDVSGNLYVLSRNTVRMVAPTGSVSTLAGRADRTGSTDGIGAAARFNNPQGIAIDTAGNLYVADTGNETIRKITPSGYVTTVAGKAENAGSTDGSGAVARFNSPWGIAVDRGGNLYVSDSRNHTVRKISNAGIVTTLAGTAGLFGAEDGIGAAARFNSLSGIAVDSSGNIYVADSGQNAIRKITPIGVVTTLIADMDRAGDALRKTNTAVLKYPRGITVDNEDNVYVSDIASIHKITPSGDITVLAGTAGGTGYIDGGQMAAPFRPVGIAVDGNDTVYASDAANHTLHKVTSTGVVTTLGSPSEDDHIDR